MSSIDEILNYDSDVDSVLGILEEEEEAPPKKTEHKKVPQKRKHSDDGPSTSVQRKKPNVEDNLWKMTLSRFGHMIYRCSERCQNKKPQVIRKNGHTYLLQEMCESCVEGNIYMHDVYYRYFGRNKKTYRK
ncbi:hypothetical protein AAVH_15731 [Aphelenchoides avenae]|nr:hypothetical protein AAVH_15731 [Aphelenchus avenae]